MNRFLKPLSSFLIFALLAGGVYFLATRNRGGTYKITAFFEKGIGLFENSDVTILGVAVGKVTDIEPEGRRVRVEMTISDDYKVPADAFAQIVPISVISDRYVQLEPVYEGGPALRDGAVLDVDRTQIPAELDDVFKQLKKLLDAIEPGQEGEPGALGELIVQLDETLRDRERDLQGTLIHGAQLTDTLARAEDDLSGILVNFDKLFGRLATRADSIGTLNHNFAVVMEALAESRFDLEDTVTNLADMTEEVGSLVRTHRERLGRDLALAARITRIVLKNRSSVEESLSWLPVVAIGLKNAHHAGQVDGTDVRDNALAKFDCADFDDYPDPIGDVLQELCEQAKPRSASAPPAPIAPEEPLVDCDKGVRKVKRQVRRIARIQVPDGLKEDVLKPLKKQLRKLKKKCRSFVDSVDPKDLIDRLIDKVGGIPEIEELLRDDGGLEGSASDGVVAPPPDDDDDGFWGGVGDWFGGWLGFVGWSS